MKAFLAAFLLATSSLFVLITPKAFAATETWDGGGSDNNMSTDANWTDNTGPGVGDDLVFPANVTDRTVVNDLPSAGSFNSITFSGTATQDSNYTISGNSMTLVAGITHSMTGSFNTMATVDIPLILNGAQTFNSGTGLLVIGDTLNLGSGALTINGTSVTLQGVVSGTGSITKLGSGDLDIEGANTYSGATTISAGTVIARQATALGTAAGATTVASGASLVFVKATGDVTVTEPLTLNGAGINAYVGALSVALAYNQSAAAVVPYPLTTFSGAITLGSNISVSADSRNGKFTGAISGNYTISLLETSTGTFEIASSSNGSATANGVLKPPTKETKYPDNSPGTAITVNTNETAIVTGTYGNVTVNVGGTLKGTGTVANALVYGTIAPGLSPGCLNTGDLTLLSTATYTFEVGGKTACTEYDQIKVTGSVAVDGTLSLAIVNSFKPVIGQKYVIISNDAFDAVTGTFTGLAEGATITSGSYSFKISYVGGDGNDVELTVLAGAPATGFKLLKSNPIVTAGVILIAAFGIFIIARRSNKLFARR